LLLLLLQDKGVEEWVANQYGESILLTCFVPCFANIMAMIKELGAKSALLMVCVITISSVIIGGMLNYLMRLLL